jgi:O-antigen/teichoic acid export membrane protein
VKAEEGTAVLSGRSDLAWIAQGGGALLLASALGNGLSYAFGIFLARMLGPGEFGLFALGLTFLNTLALTAVFGLDTAAVKFVSEQLGRGAHDAARVTIIQSVAAASLTGLLFAGGLAWASATLAASLYHMPALVPVLWWVAGAIPVVSVTTVLLSSLQAFKTVRYTVALKYAWEPAGKFALAALGLWAGWGLFGVFGAILATSVVSLLFALRWTARQAGLKPGSLHTGSWAAMAGILAFASPLIVSNLFGIIAPRSDVLILGAWATADDVGVYSAAFQTSAILALIVGAFETTIAPVMGGLLARDDGHGVETVYRVASRWLLMLTLPLFLLVVVFRNDVLSLYGDRFVAGADCLLLLACAQLFNSTTGPAASVILMAGHSRKIMTVSLVVGTLLLAGNLMLIPRFGMLGAALATTACQVLASLIRVAQVWRLHRMLPWSWGMLKPVAAGALALASAHAARDMGALASVPALMAVLLSAYAAGLLLLAVEEADRATFATITARLKLGFQSNPGGA